MSYPTFSILTAGAAFCLAGCASTAVPAERLASSEAAIRSATELGAAGTPSATLYLKLAHDNVEQAKKLIKDGDNKRADYVLMRAEADAELALAMTRETAARTSAEQVLEQVKSVKSGPR